MSNKNSPHNKQSQPFAWSLSKDGERYKLMYERDERGPSYEWTPLYDHAALSNAINAERERCDVLTDDMLRYAMAVIGTGSPADADRFRLFWRFAIEARNTRA